VLETVASGYLAGKFCLLSDDFVGEGAIILGSIARIGVFENRLAVAGRFGEPNVSADAGVEAGRIGPRGVGGSLFFEEDFDVVDDFVGEPGARFVQAVDQIRKSQILVESAGDEIDGP